MLNIAYRTEQTGANSICTESERACFLRLLMGVGVSRAELILPDHELDLSFALLWLPSCHHWLQII